MDFGALMPEINSGRMYAGPGAGPLIAAAAAWDALAAELSTTASAYQSIIEGLVSGSWHGPTAASMAAAVAPYVSWMSASAAQAEQTANQARAAVAAYETAFAATVPPPVIAANRSLLASLIATNILGQNTPAIAATEFHYAEMWAQDAAAMYGYAGSSAAASQLTPFTQPPHTTNAAGMAAQSAAVAKAAATTGVNAQSTLSQLVSTTPQALQNLTSPMAAAAAPAQSSVTSLLDFITGPTSPLSYFPIGGVPYLLAFQNVLLPMAGQNLAGALAKASAGPASSALLAGELGAGTHALGATTGIAPSVSAGIGQAGLVGKLSVPPGWASAAPAIRPAAFVLPSASLEAAPAAAMADGSGGLFSQMAVSSLAGRAVAGTGGSVTRSVGGAAGSLGGADTATTATIIVIPELDE
ncbi:PPE family protein [Mycobacterium branderi]|uniref:PPE family protein n=2 Tax=Mycobacterium branderi TaxID=43348 RepID=A0AA91LWI8_9MYCO|nr:PPE family protein [Mycobacterium branderi]MCV7234139.1 PPE family protein [Mycobacterium branderi]ORA36867.1 hypothetical protein BST20_14690 [Mycobacterium branderi]